MPLKTGVGILDNFGWFLVIFGWIFRRDYFAQLPQSLVGRGFVGV